MSRKTYTTTPLRRKLQQDILANIRATRSQIDPAVLNRAREVILQGQNGGDEKVNKLKTLTMVKEYLTLMRDNKAVCQRVSFMIEDGH